MPLLKLEKSISLPHLVFAKNCFSNIKPQIDVEVVEFWRRLELSCRAIF
jgi:hypothetical protein